MTKTLVADSRPMPLINELNAHFWKGGKDGKLHIARCGSCSLWIHPMVLRCPKCHSAEVAPQPVSGKGTVVGFSINHQQWRPDLRVPYTVALIQLDEQDDIRMYSNLPSTPIEKVRVGLPVAVWFDQQGDVFVPEFDAIEEA